MSVLRSTRKSGMRPHAWAAKDSASLDLPVPPRAITSAVRMRELLAVSAATKSSSFRNECTVRPSAVVGVASMDELIAQAVPASIRQQQPLELGAPLSEAEAIARLQHPNIVRIYDAGTLNGVPFIAMEYVEGESLERFLQRSGPMPWQHALQIAYQIADALDCAHRAGIVHRDVKPANILLDGQGRVRLSDFGIASIAKRPTTQKVEGAFLGTPEYMSPEQARGEPLDGRSDLFSLGCVLYEMATGVSPFRADSTLATLRRIVASKEQQRRRQGGGP